MLVALMLATLSPVAHAQEGMVQMGGTASTPDFYLIQQGDTLWDISTRFLGDPYQWPQLWSYNEYITNPHWIYPGNRIYFRLGDRLSPPSAALDAVQDLPYQPPEQTVAAADPLCDFPARFDGERSELRLTAAGTMGGPDDIGLNGKVIAASQSGHTLGEDDYIYAQLDDLNDVECGTLLGVWRVVGGKVKTSKGKQRVYRLAAIARVVRLDDNVATAVIRDSYSDVRRKDLIGAVMPVDVTLDLTAPSGDAEARIVARLTEDEQALPATFETVFLDRGTDDGIDVGTALYLVTQKDGFAAPDDKPDSRLPERVTGRVVVVRATETNATAVVVDAAEEFATGARLVATPNREE